MQQQAHGRCLRSRGRRPTKKLEPHGWFDDYRNKKGPEEAAAKSVAPTHGRVQLTPQAKGAGGYPAAESTSDAFSEKQAIEVYEAAEKKVRPE